MTRSNNPYSADAPSVRRRWVLSLGIAAIVLLAVMASACSSSSDSTATTTLGGDSTATTTAGGDAPAATTDASGSSSASSAVTIDPCSVVTDSIAKTVYGADATMTSSLSDDEKWCTVKIMGLGYDISINVGPASDYDLEKSIVFENPADFPGLGNEAVIGKSSDEHGASPGLLYLTDGGYVYLGGESHEEILLVLAKAIAAAQG